MFNKFRITENQYEIHSLVYNNYWLHPNPQVLFYNE